MKAEPNDLEHKLRIAINALKKYSDGSALLIKPEKQHLYAKKLEMSSNKWRQRSMSDFDDRALAKQTLIDIGIE